MASTSPGIGNINLNLKPNVGLGMVNPNFKLTSSTMLGATGGVPNPASGGTQTNIPTYAPGTGALFGGNIPGAVTPTGTNTTGSIAMGGIPRTAPPTLNSLPTAPAGSITYQGSNNPTVPSFKAPPGYEYDGQGNLTLQTPQYTPFATGQAPQTTNASNLSQGGSTYGDILKALQDNILAYQQSSQQNQDEINAQNAYLQSVQNAQNFQLSLTQGELDQYGIGRPIGLDTGRAAQIGFNNQLQTQTLTNQQGIAQQQLGYQQTARQVRTQAGATALQSQLGVAGLAKPSPLSPGTSLVSPTGEVVSPGTGFQAPTYQDITNLAQVLFQNGQFPDIGSALQYAQQNFQSIMQGQGGQAQGSANANTSVAGSSTVPLQSGNTVLGYDIGNYATNPNNVNQVAAIAAQIPSLSTASQIQAYIDAVSPKSPITGQMVYDASTSHGVDARMMLAVMQNESQFGTLGQATSTFNPGNVGNTGTSTANMGNWQTGVNTLAQNLSKRYVGANSQGSQSNMPQAPSLIQSAVGTLSDGTSFINQDKLTSSAQQTMAAIYSKQTGTPILTGDEVGKVHSIDITTQNLDQMGRLIPNILSGGLGGRISGLIGNQLQSFLQTNPDIASFQDYRTTAINSIQALAAGSGSGFRLNEGEIKVATDNLPTITDNLETAQQKLAIMQSFINKWKNELLPNQQSNPNVQGPASQTATYSLNGQTYTQGPDGLYYPSQ